jgi:hypothetical protein
LSGYIEKIFDKLKTSLSHKQKFSVDDVCEVLGSKRSTALWIVSNLSRSGRIVRLGRGVYSFDEKSRSFREPHLGSEITKAIDKLRGAGISFVLTGLDILLPFVQHQPTKIMHLIYTAAGAGTWAQSSLKKSDFTPVLEPTRQEIEKILEIVPENSELVILREKASRLALNNSVASPERAFVDLYVETTRNLIPFSVQEVAYIFINMKASLSLNNQQMVRYAHERSIKGEIGVILNPQIQNKSNKSNKPLQNFLKILEAIS